MLELKMPINKHNQQRESTMKINFYLILLGLGLLSAPVPINAGPWSAVRNSWLATKIFGKPARTELPVILGNPNYTQETRLPIQDVKPSLWARVKSFFNTRIFNFYMWQDFAKADAQEPLPAPQPARQPALPEDVPVLSTGAAENFRKRLNEIHKEAEAKKLDELAKLAESQAALDRLNEQARKKNHDLETARLHSEEKNKELADVTARATEQGRLIDAQQEEVRTKRAALLKVETEKIATNSRVEKLQEENLAYLHEKNQLAQQLREKQLTLETAEQKATEKIQRLNKTIAEYKEESSKSLYTHSSTLDQLRTAQSALERKTQELAQVNDNRNALVKELEKYQSEKATVSKQLNELGSKSSEEVKQLKNALDAEKKANEQFGKKLELSQLQASTSRADILQLNRLLESKDTTYQKEITRIQELLKNEQTDITLLMEKLEREEKQKKETIKAVTNFEHQMTAVAGRFEAFNNRLTDMNDKLKNNQNQLGKLLQKFPRLSKTTPQLPVVVASQADVNEAIESFDQKLRQAERQGQSSVPSNGQLSAGLLQSTATPKVNRSTTGELEQSFSKLPTSNEQLPIELVDEKRTSPGIEDVLQIDPVTYKHLTGLGEQYLNYIDTDQIAKIPTKTQDEYLDSIRAIYWRMYDRSLAKKQGATELTFVIKDQAKLHNFLLGFVKKVNPEITGTNKDPLSHISFNRYGYSRDASHFVHLKKEHRPYGIDMRYENGQKALLPCGHSHILFGFAKLDKTSMYLKPEHHGLFYLDGFFGHIQEFIVAQVRKNTAFARGFRYLASWCGYTIETDDEGFKHKERIPSAFLKAFAYNLAQAEELTAEQKSELKSTANRWGIQTLYNKLLTNIPVFQDMLGDYNKRFDHTEDRFGNEIKFTSLKLEIKN